MIYWGSITRGLDFKSKKGNKEANMNYTRMCSSTNIQTKQMNYLMKVKCIGEYTCMRPCKRARVMCMQ
jgi:hypothetical protein